MKPPKFIIFILVLVAAAAAYYFVSTDRTSDTVLIGIVDANQVIVSSKIMGRIEKLYVDEGSKVKAGDLVAEIDSADLEAQRDSALAVITAYGSQVTSMRATHTQTVGETNSGVANAEARVAAAQAALAQAQADLARIQSDSQRTIQLAQAGVASQQDKVRAEEQLKAQQAAGGERSEKRRGRQGRPEYRHGSHHSAACRRQQCCSQRGATEQRPRAVGRSRNPAGLLQDLRPGDRHGVGARCPPGRGGESRYADRHHH